MLLSNLFSQLQIEHLLDMTAGIKFKENYSSNPFSKMARLYLGNNSYKVIKNLKFSNKPGEIYSYKSATTAILGMVIERATGKSYARYLSEKVWQPLGMEKSALIGLDSDKHHVAKSYGGLTTNVRDLAKIGKLFLDNGSYNGTQIVDSSFVQRCLSTNNAGIKSKGRYSYSWYWGFTDDEYNNGQKYFESKDSLVDYYRLNPVKGELDVWKNDNGYYVVIHNGGYWGFGLYGQVLYINPEKNMIAVFLGADRLEDFQILFDKISVNLD